MTCRAGHYVIITSFFLLVVHNVVSLGKNELHLHSKFDYSGMCGMGYQQFKGHKMMAKLNDITISQ